MTAIQPLLSGIRARLQSGRARPCQPSRRKRRLAIESLESRDLLAVLTDSLVVGGVTANEARVFLRVNEAASLSVQYSLSANFALLRSATAQSATAAHDFTAIVQLENLSPSTRYYYRAVVNGTPVTSSAAGSFTTFATPGSTSAFSFAVTADSINAQTNPTVGAAAYQAIAAAQPAFLMQIGDFDHRNPGSLTAMRVMHRQLRSPGNASGDDFAQYIAPNMPLAHVWDDHDYGMNNGDKTFAGRSAALQAFSEYYPTVDRPNAAGIWHSFTNGPAQFFMLDVRSQRDPVDTPDGPGKSMLDGDQIANGQLSWLKQGLLNSTATWKFIASGVTFNPTTKPADAWGAYGRERQELVDFINHNHITGVIFLTGDLHSGGAIDNGVNSDFPELSVPHSNLQSTQFASGPPGTWSPGIDSGANDGGYATVAVSTTQVVLRTHAANGAVRRSYTVNAPVTPTTETLFRVNAGGPQIAGSPAWTIDTTASPSPYSNASSNGNSATSQVSTLINMSDPSVPAGTPMGIFQTERYDKPSGANLLWDFPVTPGQYQVNLYFAETYSGAFTNGARVFDVQIEHATVLDDYDVYADVGALKGVVKSFVVTSDANLDVDFLRGVQNPSIKAVEILRLGVQTSTLNASTTSLNFGDVNVGQIATRQVTLTNAGQAGAPSVTINPSQATITPAGSPYTVQFPSATLIVLAPGQSTMATVRFAPTAAGTANASLTIPHTGGNSPTGVSLAGNGVAQQSVVYRVNAGGPQLSGTPAWTVDTAGSPSPYSNASSTGASATFQVASSIDMTHPSLPTGTPMALFQTERYDKPSGANLLWDFPVTPGQYQVNLYFAETYSGAFVSGARVFDVQIEGVTVLNNYDVYADVGGLKGVVKSFIVASDANLDVDFLREVQNPAVKAIEILRVGQSASLTVEAPAASSVMLSGAPIASAAAPGGEGRRELAFQGPLMLSEISTRLKDQTWARPLRREAEVVFDRLAGGRRFVGDALSYRLAAEAAVSRASERVPSMLVESDLLEAISLDLDELAFPRW